MMQNKYQQIIEEAVSKAHEVRGNLGWNFVKKGKYYTVSNKHYKGNDFKLIKIEGNIPATIDQVQSYYYDNFKGQKDNRDMVEDIVKLEDIDKDSQVFLFQLKSKFVMSARQSLSIFHRRALSDKCFLLVCGKLDEHPKLPPNKNMIRSEITVYAQFLTFIDQNTTKFELYFLNDPKGSVPSFIMNNLADSFLTNFEKDYESIIKLK